ncbi:hypothetical protein D3C73_791960 [compost metagenome]
MNALFNEYISDGYKVNIEFMKIEEVTFNNRACSVEDLKEVYFRQLIENALIIEHKVQGYTLLNK